MKTDRYLVRHFISNISFSRMASALIQAVFPSRCLKCRRFIRIRPLENCHESGSLTLSDNNLLNPFFCDNCLPGFQPITSPLCPICGTMFAARDDRDHLCGACLGKPRRFASARAAGVYGDILQIAVHQLKYTGKIQLARPMGRLLFRIFLDFSDRQPIDMVMPVPLHPSRLRQRGFNQADLLINEWEALFNTARPGIVFPVIERDILKRVRKTRSQMLLGKADRKRNIRNAFGVDPKKCAGMIDARILLIDDVYTTGATIDECARVLLRAGAARVDALTVARTL